MAREHVVLLAFSDARGDLPELREEARRLQALFEAFQQQARCTLVFRPNATLEQIFEVLQEHRDRVAIFHYGGHADSGRLLLEAGLEGGPAHVEGLAQLLGQQRGLGLAFLNGCSTRPQVQRLLDAGVPAVIATARSVDDRVARDFAVAFYQSLTTGGEGGSGGMSVASAFSAAQGYVRASRGGTSRDLVAYPPAHDDVTDALGMPWDLQVRDGAEQAERWSFFGDDPLFGLPPLPPRDLPDNPYLEPLSRFTADRAELFFGRGAQVRELYERATDPDGPPIVLVYGQSGVGKSSLLDAGLVPRLAAGGRAVRYHRRDSQAGLLGSLRATLADERAQPDIGAAWRAEEARLGRPLVIILDQVEEALTGLGGGRPSELEAFIDALREAWRNRADRPLGRLILGFRKEWLAEIERRLGEAGLPRARGFLEALDRRGIVEAVEGPARQGRMQRRYGLEIEEGLAATIADDLLSDPASPVGPTLQVLLSKLWEQAVSRDPSRPKLDRRRYESLRRQGALLGDFLDRQLAVLQGWNQEVVDSGLALDLLEYHTTPLGSAEERTTGQLAETYGHVADGCRDLVRRCLDLYLLSDAGSPGGAEAGATRLMHDSLAPLVRERYETSDRAGQRARRILRGRASEWVVGREGTPLDDADLRAVESNASAMRAWSESEGRLVEASRAERNRRECLRQRLQGEALLRSIGHSAGPIGRVELEALWELAELSEESARTRILLLDAALGERGRAQQLANRLAPVVHAAVGLCPARRKTVLSEVVLPVLRRAEADPLVRWTAARIGLFLHAEGEEYVALASEALVDYLGEVKEQVLIEPEAEQLARLLPSSVARRVSKNAAARLIRSCNLERSDSTTSRRILAALIAYLPDDEFERANVHVLPQLWGEIVAAEDSSEIDRLTGLLKAVAGRTEDRRIKADITRLVDGLEQAPSERNRPWILIIEAMYSGLADSNAEWLALLIVEKISEASSVLALESLVSLASRMADRLDPAFAEQLAERAMDRITGIANRDAVRPGSVALDPSQAAEFDEKRRELVELLISGRFGDANQPAAPAVIPPSANARAEESAILLVELARLERALAAERFPTSAVKTAIEQHADVVLTALAGTRDRWIQVRWAARLKDAGKLPGSVGRRAVDVLLAAMTGEPDSVVLASMASALVVISMRPQRQAVERAAEIMLEALNSARGPFEIETLADAFASLSDHLAPGMLDRLIAALNRALNSVEDPGERSSLARTLGTFSVKLPGVAMEPPGLHVAAGPSDIPPFEASANSPSSASSNVSTNKEGAERTAEALIEVLDDCSDLDALARMAADLAQTRLPKTLAALAAERYVGRLTPAVEARSYGFDHVESLRLVTGFLTVPTAERVAVALRDGIQADTGETLRAWESNKLATMLALVLTKLPEPVARDIAEQAVEGIRLYARNSGSAWDLASAVDALGHLAAWLPESAVGPVAERAAMALVESLDGVRDADERRGMGNALSKVLTHLPAASAPQVFDGLFEILESGADPDGERWWLLNSLWTTTSRLCAADAEAVVDRVGDALIEATDAGEADLAFDLGRILATLGKRVPDRASAAFSEAIDVGSSPRMVALLARALVKSSDGPPTWFPASTAGVVAGRMLEALNGTDDPMTLAQLAWALAVAGWLPESAAGQVAERVTGLLETAVEPQHVEWLAGALDRVITFWASPDADHFVFRAAEALVGGLQAAKDQDALVRVSSALIAFKPRLRDDAAAMAAKILIGALVASHSSYRTREVVSIVDALLSIPVAFWEESAAEVADRLQYSDASAKNPEERAELDEAMQALASRLPESLAVPLTDRVAERAAERVVGQLIEAVHAASESARPRLLDVLKGVPRLLTAHAAERTSAQLLDALEKVDDRDWRAQVLEATSSWLSETAAGRAAGRLVAELEGLTGESERSRVADALVAVSAGVSASTVSHVLERLHDMLASSFESGVDSSTSRMIATILSGRGVDNIVEVLKFPLCLGSFRSSLLAILGRRLSVNISEETWGSAEGIEALGVASNQMSAPVKRSTRFQPLSWSPKTGPPE